MNDHTRTRYQEADKLSLERWRLIKFWKKKIKFWRNMRRNIQDGQMPLTKGLRYRAASLAWRAIPGISGTGLLTFLRCGPGTPR